MGSEGIHDRYINPYTDFGFKKLFGTELNKELLISFINALFAGKEVVEDITYLNTEHLGSGELDRKSIFDVYCVNEKGERFLVEMQKAEQGFFKDRSIFYSTFPIREQAIKGEWDYELKGVYTICILNFILDNQNDNRYLHEIKLMDTYTKEIFFDKLTYIYLEMPKFNKTEEELHTLLDKWMFVLRNLARLMERPRALQERVFESLFRAAEIASFNTSERYDYEESLKNYRDMYSVLKTAEEKGLKLGMEKGIKKGMEQGLQQGLQKGLEKGLQKGKEEGAKLKQYEIARKLRSLGMTTEQIMEATQLKKEEIEKL